ncbi:MAG: hypothetical protein KDD67_09820 [Ignavibacteriae bacterium]|nr:hypothetical protein [Ignavibacteriota bacterium]
MEISSTKFVGETKIGPATTYPAVSFDTKIVEDVVLVTVKLMLGFFSPNKLVVEEHEFDLSKRRTQEKVAMNLAQPKLNGTLKRSGNSVTFDGKLSMVEGADFALEFDPAIVAVLK